MGGQRLSRDLRYIINRMAHEHAQAVCGALNYKARYAEEKARLQAVAVTMLAAGNSVDEVLAKLQHGQSARGTKMRGTLKALLQQLKEMR
jgi:hypothetical protein